jgi:hypothetical protein
MGRLGMVMLLGIAAAGCTVQSEEPGDIDGSSVQTELGEERQFGIERGTSNVSIVVGGTWLDEETIVDLELSHGTATVVADGDELTVTSIDLQFADMEFGSAPLLKDGGFLSDLSVNLKRDTVAESDWGRQSVEGDGALDLTVGWSLRLKGHELDLSDQTISDLPFTVSVSGHEEDGALSLSLETSAEGELWSLAPVLELRRLELSLKGATTR